MIVAQIFQHNEYLQCKKYIIIVQISSFKRYTLQICVEIHLISKV